MTARLAFFLALALGFVAPGIVAGSVPAFRDFLVLVVPMRFAAARAIAAGDFPLWTPDLFLGAPFFANYQSAILYPPSLLVYVLPEPMGLSAFLGLHLALAGLGMATYLEKRELLSREGALLGGTVYAAGGFFASLLPLTNHLEAATWLPWLLLAAESTYESRSRKHFVGLCLLAALQVLTGAPETILLTWILLAALLARLAIRTGFDVARATAVAAALVLGVAFCSVQLLPTLEYARQSDRAAALPFEVVLAESIAPRSLQQLLLPHTFTDGAPDIIAEGGVPLFWSIYLGVAPLLVLFARAPIGFWSAVVLSGLVFALGPHLPLLGAAYQIAPGLIGLFRYPGKFFLLCHFALAVLAAHGVARALDSSCGSLRATAAGIAGVAVAVAVSAALAFAPSETLALLGFDLRPGLDDRVYAYIANGISLTALRFALLAAVMAAALEVARRSIDRRASVGFLLVVATAVELVALHRPLMGYVPWAELASADPRVIGLRPGDRAFHYCESGFGCRPAGAPGFGAWTGTLRVGEPVDEQARTLWRSFVPNVSTLYDVAAVGGRDGFLTREQRWLADGLVSLPPSRGARLLASFGVSAMVGQPPSERFGVTPAE